MLITCLCRKKLTRLHGEFSGQQVFGLRPVYNFAVLLVRMV